jgi:Holliday junction resolvase
VKHYPRRRDANHKDIVNALRAVGCSVVDLGEVGKGCPDLLCGIGGKTFLVEVKNPLTRRGQQGTGLKTAERQAKFRELWYGSPVRIIETVDAALKAAVEASRS